MPDAKAIPLEEQKMALDMMGYTTPGQREQLLAKLLKENRLASEKRWADTERRTAELNASLNSAHSAAIAKKGINYNQVGGLFLGGAAGAAGGAGLGHYLSRPENKLAHSVIGGSAGAIIGVLAAARMIKV